MRRAAGFVLLAAFALALAACSTDKKPANPDIFPTDYRKEIFATLQDLFKSNETVKITGAMVSDPAQSMADKERLYTACVRYTAHGVRPGEIGNAVRVAYFLSGHLNQLIPAEKDQCLNAAYKPFPELNRFCAGTGCK